MFTVVEDYIVVYNVNIFIDLNKCCNCTNIVLLCQVQGFRLT
jgi:hypothetical protein